MDTTADDPAPGGGGAGVLMALPKQVVKAILKYAQHMQATRGSSGRVLEAVRVGLAQLHLPGSKVTAEVNGTSGEALVLSLRLGSKHFASADADAQPSGSRQHGRDTVQYSLKWANPNRPPALKISPGQITTGPQGPAACTADVRRLLSKHAQLNGDGCWRVSASAAAQFGLSPRKASTPARPVAAVKGQLPLATFFTPTKCPGKASPSAAGTPKGRPPTSILKTPKPNGTNAAHTGAHTASPIGPPPATTTPTATTRPAGLDAGMPVSSSPSLSTPSSTPAPASPAKGIKSAASASARSAPPKHFGKLAKARMDLKQQKPPTTATTAPKRAKEGKAKAPKTASTSESAKKKKRRVSDAPAVAKPSPSAASPASTELREPYSAFVRFTMGKRPALREAHPNLSFPEITGKLKELWNQLSADSKKPFVAEFEREMTRYREQRAALESGGKESKQRTIKDMFSKQPTPRPKKKLTPEEKAKRDEKKRKQEEAAKKKQEEHKRKMKLKLMTKAEKEAEKTRQKEERRLERERQKAERKVERERQKLLEKEQKLKEAERLKPREDSELDDSLPLACGRPVPSRLPRELFSDTMMICEFVFTFQTAFSTELLKNLTPTVLEDTILDHENPHRFSEIVACLLVNLLEILAEERQEDEDHEPNSRYGQDICDLPVNAQTTSEVLRLYLEDMEYDDEPLLAMLRKHELAMAAPKTKVGLLAYLCNKHFEHFEVRDMVKQAVTDVPIQRRRQLELQREQAKQKKGADKGKGKPTSQVDEDARLAAQMAAELGRSRSTRATRSASMTPEERAAQSDEKVSVEDEQLAVEQQLVTLMNTVRNVPLGLDRDRSEYWTFYTSPGLFCLHPQAGWTVYDNSDTLEAFVATLNERGVREKALKEAIGNEEPLMEDLGSAAVVAFGRTEEERAQTELDLLLKYREDIHDMYVAVCDGGFGCARVDGFEKQTELAATPPAVAELLLDIEERLDMIYLKPPLGHDTKNSKAARDLAREGTETDALADWKQSAGSCDSISQVYLLFELLHESIRWEKSATLIKCKICRKTSGAAAMLLCDQCDHGFHMFCLKPRVTEVPDGEWYCNSCKPRVNPRKAARALEYAAGSGDESDWSEGQYVEARRSSRKRKAVVGLDPSREEKRAKSAVFTSSSRGRVQHKHLAMCLDIWKAVNKREDSWPFLEPVNPKECPDYRSIVQHPMDLQTVRNKLDSLEFDTHEDFAADMRLMFRNCAAYNPPDTPVADAGKGLGEYFELLYASEFAGEVNERSAKRSRPQYSD